MNAETDRLTVRAFTADDFDDYFAYIMEPELQRMLGLHGVNSRESALDTFRWLLNNREFLALVKKETGKVIGHICIHPSMQEISANASYDGKTGRSLSFAVAKAERRKGYMEEALRSLIDELFECRKIDFIDLEHATFNTASHALQEKLGFTYWGRERFDDVELIINVLRREDWNNR